VADCGLFSLLRAASSVEAYVESRLAPSGLSLPKLAALAQLVKANGSLPLGQLADRLACVKSNVTQLVDRLEADGLVTRTLDASDRRSRLAILTAAGRSAHDEGTRIQREAGREIFGALSCDDVTTLGEIIGKLQSVCAPDPVAR
jgi:DNA-binding MarR family transcriptional regulator